jgi:OmpA-OmpF porin, OOP family
MLIKKYLLAVGLVAITGHSLLAQETPTATTPPAGAAPAGAPQWSSRDMTYKGKNYDVLDSAYYPKKRLKQYRQYMDHQSVFPPKPRNQWEVGGGIGLYSVRGDVPALNFFQRGGGGIHLQVRKAWGYVFSTRLQYIYGVGKNLDVQPTQSYDGPYTSAGYVPIYNAATPAQANNVYRGTRTESSQLSLDLMFNIYNINFHNATSKLSFYGYVGLGALAYKTRVNALDGNFQRYDYDKIATGSAQTLPDNKTVRKNLQSGMDKTYESPAESSGGNTILDDKTLDFAPSFGAGVQYRVNKTWSLQVENRITLPNDDYLDGTRYGSRIGNSASISQSKDGINYFSLGVGYNVKTKKKSVAPLWWINPLDHAYSELSYPRHMLLPNPVLPDEDNDGITDQFDKCPKTPASVATDIHGCPMDSDGDGVPDYKDKQLITPTECQPVDADGVGHCPCPEGCGDANTKKKCGKIEDGMVRFNNNSSISPTIQEKLATLAAQMKAYPDCKVVVMGGGAGGKKEEQKAWEKVNAVIEFMTEKQNILRDRFIFQYDKGDDQNVVNFRAADPDETGPSAPPPPHPNLK